MPQLLCACAAYIPNIDDAKFLLFGERHGVVEQQLKIAELIEGAITNNETVGVIMEMISADQTELLKAY